MPEYTVIAVAEESFDFLEEEYTWFDERRDRCGSYIDKESIPEWLGDPVIIYYDEDIKFKKGEDQNSWRIEGAVKDDLSSIRGLKERLKNKRLATKLEKKGGVVYFIQDSDHGFIALFWAGKTKEQVIKLVANEQNKDARLTAVSSLENAMQSYVELFSKEELKTAFDAFYAK